MANKKLLLLQSELHHHILATGVLGGMLVLSVFLFLGINLSTVFADVSASVTFTSDADFNSGTLTDLEIEGTGNAASLKLLGSPGVDNTIYRTELAISNPSGSTQTDASFLVEFDSATLISNTQMASDCRDLRFTEDDETTKLDYWLESGCNTSTTRAWVQIDTLPAGGTTIYMFHKNDALASESSLTDVLYAEPTVARVNAPADGGWIEIEYPPYQEPIVVGTGQDNNGQNGVIFETRNVTNTSAEIRLCDSNGGSTDGCDTYPEQPAGYMVVDTQLNSEMGFEAGTFDIDGGITADLQSVSFNESFSTTPIVLYGVQTRNEDTPVEAWPTSVTSGGFTAGICHQSGDDTCDYTHPFETLGWVAIDPNNLPFGLASEAGSVSSVSNSEWQIITFSTPFSSTPVVIVEVQDNSGNQNPKIDEADNVTTSTAIVRYCELDQGDDCDSHAAMRVGWYAVETTPTFPGTTVGDTQLLLASTGEWVSADSGDQVIDLVWNGGWGNGTAGSIGFSANLQNVGANANITFQVRAAATKAGLASESYTTLGSATTSPFELTNSDLTTLGIATGTAGRYLQIRAVHTSNDGITNPYLDDFTINYMADDTAPNVNASGIQMYRTLSGAEVTDGDWTNNPAAYFTWTGGNDTQAGIMGYCMYIGSDPSGDPELSKGLLGTSPVDTTGTSCSFIAPGTSIDFANASYRGGTWLTSSNDLYYINMKAIDEAGNIFNGSSTSFSFKYDDTPPKNPAYISLPGGFVSDKDVTFIWPTSGGDAASDDHSGLTGLQYRIGQTGVWYGDSHTGAEDITDLMANDGTYTMDPTHDYPNINEGSNFIYVRSWDIAGNVTSSYISGVLKLNTISPTPPQNLTVTPTDNTLNSYAFSWNPPASFLGQEENLEYCYTINTLPSATSCTYTDPGETSLAANAYANQPGVNTLYLVARDEAANINYDTYEFVQFTYSGTAPGIPTNLDVADISIKATSNWRLALTWEKPTNEGAGVTTYKIYRSAVETTCAANFASFSPVATVGSTYFSDIGLNQQDYYYCVTACDSANNCSAPSGTSTGYPDGKFTEPANLLSGPTVSNLTTRSAKISWQTDRNSDSKVSYGRSSDSYFTEEPSIPTQTLTHEIELNGLQPGTSYYYRAKWTDEDGNTGVSAEKIFTTLPAPTVKDVQVVRVGLEDALIRFTVSGASSANVYFGKTTSFGGLVPISTSAAESTYTTVLDGLDDGSRYFFKINPVDTTGFEYEGTVLNFDTLPRPQLSNIQIQEVQGVAQPTVNVTWESNTEVSSILIYYPAGAPQDSREKVDIELVKGEHELDLSGLLPNTQYNLVVKGIDKIGNEATSDVLVFTTATDTRPPEILNLQVEGDIASGAEDRAKSAQLIISWQTDEPATSQVEFGLGTTGSYTQRTQEDVTLKTDHLVVISNLSTSEVYHLRAVAKDSAENSGESGDTVSITPKASDSALELVISNLGQIFGFLIN